MYIYQCYHTYSYYLKNDNVITQYYFCERKKSKGNENKQNTPIFVNLVGFNSFKMIFYTNYIHTLLFTSVFRRLLNKCKYFAVFD